MTQKLAFYLFTIVTIILFSACSDNDEKTEKNRLPETARAFIDNRLDGYSILNIEEVDDKGNESNEKYIVTLTNDLTVSFSSMGYWRRIESSSELPEKLQQEIAYDGAEKVKAKYPSKTINKMYFLPYFYKVVLDDDTSLIVYTDNGTDMKVGADMHGKLAMNKKIYDFLLAHYATPGLIQTYEFFQEEESDGSGYRFYLSNGQNAYFDKEGDWYYLDGSPYHLPENIYNTLLPQELRDIIENKYKGNSASIHRIIYHKTYYQVLLKMGNASTAPFFVVYDTASQTEMEPPQQAMLDFLNNYIEEPNKGMTFTSKVILSTKEAVYEFTGTLNGSKLVSIRMTYDGRMCSIILHGTEIPKKVLDYLPAAIKQYVEENIPATEAIVFVNNGFNDEYFIQFKSGARVKYDKEGNILK